MKTLIRSTPKKRLVIGCLLLLALCVARCATALADECWIGTALPKETATLVPPPTVAPTVTARPTATVMPSPTRTPVPTAPPSPTPTIKPTATPSPTPTIKPTATPSPTPTIKPTATPSPTPTIKPAATPSPTPTLEPTPTLSSTPTLAPTATILPLETATVQPTSAPLSPEASSTVIVQTGVRYAIDFSYMQSVSANSVAWLYQPGTSINTPVMLSRDVTFYLRRQFNNRVSASGSIFMVGEETPDFTAPCITLLGRNCTDCTLFGSLSLYKDDAYYQAHPTLLLVTPEGNYQLDIFAGVQVKSNDSSWIVKQNTTASMCASDLPSILAKSFITPNPALLPTEEDAWAVLATQMYSGQGSRFVVYARKRPVTYQTATTVYLNEMEMDARETQNGRVYVPGVGSWMLYAQNDPLWNRLTFEAQRRTRKRPFGDGGCGPTSVAMAIANLVDKSDLSKLNSYASSPFGYQFCSCSVNEYWCSGKHLPYRMATADAFERYFPLAVASFATGNNVWGVKGRVDGFGTNMSYLKDICSVYGISLTSTDNVTEAIDFLQKEHTIAIACTLGNRSPFTNTSHFLVLAGVKDGYLYVLDPLRRTSYESVDSRGYLELLAPGLVRLKVENAPHCNFYSIYELELTGIQPEAVERKK